jgi:hypothetical protein
MYNHQSASLRILKDPAKVKFVLLYSSTLSYLSYIYSYLYSRPRPSDFPRSFRV